MRTLAKLCNDYEKDHDQKIIMNYMSKTSGEKFKNDIGDAIWSECDTSLARLFNAYQHKENPDAYFYGYLLSVSLDNFVADLRELLE